LPDAWALKITGPIARYTTADPRVHTPSLASVREVVEASDCGTPWAQHVALITSLQKRANDSGLRGPEEVELFFDEGEVFVAGGERGFARDGEGGGETVGVGEFLFGSEFGGTASQFQVGGDDLQRKLGDVLDDLAGDAGAFGAPWRRST